MSNCAQLEQFLFFSKFALQLWHNNTSLLPETIICRGVPEVLKKRLKSYYKEQKLPFTLIEGQYYPYMIVVDFEATCEETNPTDYLHEIIEFPAVLIDASSLTVVRFRISLAEYSLTSFLGYFAI